MPSQTSCVRLRRQRDPVRLLVVAEAAPEARAHDIVERLLAGVTERRVPRVVTEADRLDEILVQAQGSCDDPRDRGRLERVRHPRPGVIPDGIDEDLRLPLEPTERLRMHETIPVALKGRAHTARLLGDEPPSRLERRERRTARARHPHALSRSPRIPLCSCPQPQGRCGAGRTTTSETVPRRSSRRHR